MVIDIVVLHRKGVKMTRKLMALLVFVVMLCPMVIHAEWRTMNVSAYCDYGMTASGEWVREGIVASDDLPFGTVVIINGNRYVVADRFGGGYSDRIDIYMPSYDDCMSFGQQYLDVYVDR